MCGVAAGMLAVRILAPQEARGGVGSSSLLCHWRSSEPVTLTLCALPDSMRAASCRGPLTSGGYPAAETAIRRPPAAQLLQVHSCASPAAPHPRQLAYH
jgi:hypothetical protein